MGLRRMAAAALLLAAALPAAAQGFTAAPAAAPGVSTAAAYAPPISLGAELPASGGPWVLGEVLFFSNGSVVSDYAWRDRLRGQVGQLYTASDLQEDVATLNSLGAFTRVTPAVHEMPDTPIPPQFSGIAASTSEVRVVFDVALKVSSAPAVRLVTPPSAVSGLILTPTAYRGAGHHNTPGLGLDFNGTYFIGRLYGKNNYENSPDHTNYIDRLGLWLLSADGKMEIQSDRGWRPAVAVGGQGTLMFRDSPQPTVQEQQTGVSVQVNAKSTRVLTDAYLVASKEFHGVRTSAGLMMGDFGDIVSNLSEYLTPEAMQFYRGPVNLPVAAVYSRTMPFASVFYLVKPDYPIGAEIIKFNGAYGDPYLINFKLGRFLHLNFDVALLKFTGGYDALGLFQFRFNEFPRR
ncbi:MAG: hypothetical protein KGM24_12625 [Elusimicrobia bacterium]|nr:hypothetical protein [Elusimicrobiota bacterium]